MKGKKADLLNNVLTTIIAVIGLALLAYAAWRLYSVYANQDEESVKRTLNFIEDKINDIADGQDVIVTIKGVEGWFLTGWQKDDISRPDKCALYSCICVCEGTVLGQILSDGRVIVSNAPEICQKTGFCREIDADRLVILGTDKMISTGDNPYKPEYTWAKVPAVSFQENNLYELTAGKKREVDGKLTLEIKFTS